MAEKSEKENFLRQFRDVNTREFKQISANQFMEVWNHYDTDGREFVLKPFSCFLSFQLVR